MILSSQQSDTSTPPKSLTASSPDIPTTPGRQTKGIAIFRMIVTLILVLLSLVYVLGYLQLLPLPFPLTLLFSAPLGALAWGFMGVYASLVLYLLWLHRSTPPEAAKFFGHLLLSYFLLALASLIGWTYWELIAPTVLLCLAAFIIEFSRIITRFVSRLLH